MNNLFEKNISALRVKNKELADRLEKHILTEVPQLVKENGFFNLTYRNVYLHHQTNPLDEAKEIFFRSVNTPVAIHVIYGLGLGYLFQIAAANSKGTVILYEQDLNIMRIAFSLVDFSNDILKDNIRIADNLEQVGEYIYQKSNTENSPQLLSTTNYRELFRDDFNSTVEKLQRLVGAFGMDLRFTKNKFYSLTKSLLKNVPSLLNEVPLSSIKGCYKGKTALVVSAGPSLDRDIEIVKKYRDRVVIFVVGTAMKTLAKHNITPDFLCIIESYDSSKQIAGLDLSKVNFITEPYSNPNLRKFEFRKTFSHISANLPINEFWANMIGEDATQYWSKGSVSYTALNSARLLGCSKIVLTGQDLAYIEGQCYSKDSAYKDLVCCYDEAAKKWEIKAKDFDAFVSALSNSTKEEARIDAAKRRLKNLNDSLYYIKGIKGDMIPTESVYATFIKPLSEFTQTFKGIEYVNTSLVGAQIDGFENISLEDALKDSPIIEKREFEVNYDSRKQKVREKLGNQLGLMKTVHSKIEEAQKIARQMKNSLMRFKNTDLEILKSLKQLTVKYCELSYDCTKENPLFDFISIAERIELDYEMKMTQEFSYDTVVKLTEKIAKYLEVAEKRTNVISDILDKTIKDLG